MSTYDHHDQVTDDDLGDFLLELSNSERRRLLTLVATRLEPKAIIGPLTEGVAEALEGSPGEELTNAEVKDAVRRALIESMKARQTHLSQLAQLLQMAEEKERDDALARKVREFCGTIGVKKVTGAEDLSLFRVVEGDPESDPHAEVIKPAYVEELGGRLIVAGEVVFTATPRGKSKEDRRKKGVCPTCGNTMAGRRIGKKGKRP